jgi:hypothetical protein
MRMLIALNLSGYRSFESKTHKNYLHLHSKTILKQFAHAIALAALRSRQHARD